MLNRVSLTFPKHLAQYQCQLQVRVGDINYGNHVGNDKLVSYLHEARVLFLKQLNYTEFDIEGVGLIQADLMVRYINEAFWGDVLTCSILTTNFGAHSFEMHYLLSAERQGEAIEIAVAKVGLVCYNYETKSKMEVPRSFVQKIDNLKTTQI